MCRCSHAVAPHDHAPCGWSEGACLTNGDRDCFSRTYAITSLRRLKKWNALKFIPGSEKYWNVAFGRHSESRSEGACVLDMELCAWVHLAYDNISGTPCDSHEFEYFLTEIKKEYWYVIVVLCFLCSFRKYMIVLSASIIKFSWICLERFPITVFMY